MQCTIKVVHYNRKNINKRPQGQLNKKDMESIITAATVATMFFNVANSTTSDYVYNADMENGKVESFYVMNTDGKYLTNKLRYDYSYDEQDRLVEKTAMLWNAKKMTWEPDFRLDFAYTSSGYSVERRDWDAKSGEFADVSGRMEYEMMFDEVMAVNTYKRDRKTNAFELTDNFLVMNPQNQLLAEVVR